MDNQIEWNINQGFGILLLKLIDEVNHASLRDNLEWFNTMRVLFRNIEGIEKIDAEKMENLDKKMMLLSNRLNRPQAKTKEGRAFQLAGLKNIIKELDGVNRDLMKAINEANIIKFHIDRIDPAKSVLT